MQYGVLRRDSIKSTSWTTWVRSTVPPTGVPKYLGSFQVKRNGQSGGIGHEVGNIDGDEEIDRQAGLDTGLYHAIDLLGGGGRVHEECRVLSYGLTHLLISGMIPSIHPQSMMYLDVVTLHIAGGVANDVDDRNIFAVRSGDTVDRAELSNTIGCYDGSRYAPCACVAVGSIGGVEFVAGAHPSHVRDIVDVVKEIEIEVSGNTEDVAETELVQTTE